MAGNILQIVGTSGVDSRAAIVGDRTAIAQLREACRVALIEGSDEFSVHLEGGTRQVAVVLVDTHVAPKSRRRPRSKTPPSAHVPSPAPDLGLIPTIGTGQTFLRIGEVMSICGISRTSIYAGVKDKSFPAPVKLSGRSVAWVKDEVLEWINARVSARHP